MRRVEAFARFLWDFVVGDDWQIALGVIVGIAITALLAGSGVSAWWVLPVLVAALLAFSVWRAAAPPG
jgi:uncharacterized membrane protein (DUF441 family)